VQALPHKGPHPALQSGAAHAHGALTKTRRKSRETEEDVFVSPDSQRALRKSGGNSMNSRIALALVAAAGIVLAPAAFAQNMGKDRMEKTDAMKSDKPGMAKSDGMSDKKTDAMKKDSMKKDGMSDTKK
jgi:pentapeptide MXKDX repeat protein